MNRLRQIGESFSRWIDSVAENVHSLIDRWRGVQRRVQLIEQEQDTFTLHAVGSTNDASLPDQRIRIAQGAIAETLSADWLETFRGSRAELVLRPTRFMFRPLELPKRAAEFLDGIVRAQIDRLTPWTVSEAVYSWTPPIEAGNERIQLTVAATARAQVTPYVQALAALGATAGIPPLPHVFHIHVNPFQTVRQDPKGQNYQEDNQCVSRHDAAKPV